MQSVPVQSETSPLTALSKHSLGTHLRQLDWLHRFAAQRGKSAELLSVIDSTPELRECLSELGSEVTSLAIQAQDALKILRGKVPHLFPEPTLQELQNSVETYSRSPFRRTAEKIAREDILVVTKKSKLEWDMERLNLSQNEVLALYSAGAEDVERIMASHLWQKYVQSSLSLFFSPSQLLSYGEATKERLADAKLVIALGGDDHHKYVSHALSGNTALLGINSDSPRSYGALLSDSAENLGQVLQRLSEGDYFFEPWTRLRASCNGSSLPLAEGDFFLGDQMRKATSRHSLRLENNGDLPLFGPSEAIEQKGSGLLITTGSGSTGWPESGGRYLLENLIPFPAWARCARFILTEASSAIPGVAVSEGVQAYAHGLLLEGQKLIVTSLNKAGGILTSDSCEEVPFQRGKEAIIEIDPDPLWVVQFKDRMGHYS